MLPDYGAALAALVLGLPAAAYAAVRVIRRDQREDNALDILERTLTQSRVIVEQDRDYWRKRAADDVRDVEARMTARLLEHADGAALERQALYRQIEDLRRALHAQGLQSIVPPPDGR